MISEIGKHVVRCGDVMDDLDELFAGRKADIYYSDLPWSNLKYWSTLNRKMNDVDKEAADEVSFLNRICETIHKYVKDDGIIFIEYGIKMNDLVVELFQQNGLKFIGKVELVYGSPERPSMINIFTKGKDIKLSEEYIKNLYHTKSMKTLESAMTPFLGDAKIITDLCCGMGKTAKYCCNHGLTFIGNEINQKRLDKTISILENDKHSKEKS